MKPSLTAFLRLTVVAAVGAVLLQGCAALPGLDGRSESAALQNTGDTRIGRAVAPLVEAHPGRSGVVSLRDGRDAFAARALLADAAERSLDVQYYIWHGDTSGSLLFDALRRAADRGVRVRLLLDDNGTAGLDAVLAALDAHPSIEVRLFNPFMSRRWRVLGYLTDFARLNRRMHNKSFTADNQATIVGGRNVGDEYFDASQEVSFVDLDVLAIGPVVQDVSADFDRYWASGSAYPVDRVLPEAAPQPPVDLAAAASRLMDDPAARAYAEALARLPFVHDMLAGRLQFEWAVTRLVSDDPAKGLGQAGDDALLWPQLERIVGAPRRELRLVSPYFVPGDAGTRALADMARRGVRVSVLTNSLEATDVAAVHSGYAKRRRPLLEAGVTLYELKRAFASASPAAVRSANLAGGSLGSSGSSGASLHAKTFEVDRERVFVGSFNFDPRSARLNTELGFVIDSPAMAEEVAAAFERRIPERSYALRLDDAGALQWVERGGDGEAVHDQEPGSGVWQRLGVRLLSLLPIEWLL